MSLSLSNPTLWLVIGFSGQAIFTARFLVQWVASERRRDSVVPVAFWWLSLAGGTTLLAYAIHRQDPVIIVGQSMGAFIYIRNLMLVQKGRQRVERQAAPHTRRNQAGRGKDHRGPRRPVAHRKGPRDKRSRGRK